MRLDKSKLRWVGAVCAFVALVAALSIGMWLSDRKPVDEREEVDWRLLVSQTDADRADTDSDEEESGKMTLKAPTKKEIEATKAHGPYTAIISTDKGDIELNLRGDLMPLTVANFVNLAKSGFYDGLTFHRVEDWVVQGGDPQGDGYGNPGYSIKLEISKELTNTKGAIAMARSEDPNSAGSQFYILKSKADWLDGQYAVFGNVTKGMAVVEKIAAGDKMNKVIVK